MDNVQQPLKIKRFNFGAFFLPLIWSIANRQFWIAALVAVLYGFGIHHAIAHSMNSGGVFSTILLAVGIYLGIKGTRLAWNTIAEKKGDAADPDWFRTTQKAWSIAGLTVFGILVLSVMLPYIASASRTNTYSEEYEYPTYNWDSVYLEEVEDVF